MSGDSPSKTYEMWVPGKRPLVIGQLGGCNLSQIARQLPGTAIGGHALRTSTISLVRPPLAAEHFATPVCPLKAKFIAEDFGKHYAERLFAAPDWDVLLIDFLRDYLGGAIEVGGTYVTEINEWIHGEPIEAGDLFVSPWRLIDWRDPAYFDLWSAAATRLYVDHLRPNLDAGRRIVVHELLPSSGEYVRQKLEFVPHPDGRERESGTFLRRLYSFIAELDPRIEVLRVEDAYAIGAFDAENGLFDFHMVADYAARAAELLAERLNIPRQEVSAKISAERLAETRRRYDQGFQFELELHERLGAIEYQSAAREKVMVAELATAHSCTERLELELEATRASLNMASDNLASTLENLESSSTLRTTQAGMIASLTRKLDAEIKRSADMHTAFMTRDTAQREEIAQQERDFQALARERDDLMARFREHVVYYDHLSEEMDRRVAADDATYAAVLSLTEQLRRHAERQSALESAAQLQPALAAARDDLSVGLVGARQALAVFAGAMSGPEQDERLVPVPVVP